MCLCDRGTGWLLRRPGGNWLKCRSISFSWFFAIYEPKTCDDEISGMWEWDDGEFWGEDSVVMMVDGVEEC